MNPAPPQVRFLAERLIAREADDSNLFGPAVQVFDKFRQPLATLMGECGFQALVSRSLVLATRDIPWLRTVELTSTGDLKELKKLEVQLSPEEITEDRVVIVTQLLELLVKFIGEYHTVRLVRETWPDLPRLHALRGRAGSPEGPGPACP